MMRVMRCGPGLVGRWSNLAHERLQSVDCGSWSLQCASGVSVAPWLSVCDVIRARKYIIDI
eukprot:2177310-Prymnesium_polylepis.2